MDKVKIVAGEGDLILHLGGGSKWSVEIKVKKIHIHPGYKHAFGKKVKITWDLAMIEVKSKIPVEDNPKIDFALLPSPGLTSVGAQVKVGGWGKTSQYSGSSPDHLVINVAINSGEKCLESYTPDEYDNEQMLCIGDSSRTACQGDSGGSAILQEDNKPVILGVLSFGNKQCKKPAVFQRIEKSLSWILGITNIR